MSITDVLKSQHETILQLVLQIEQNLNPAVLSQKADKVNELLALLTRRLTLHLAMEDKALYPLLITDQDEKIRRITIKFIDEMGGLADLFKTYAAKWNSTEHIQKRAVEFCEESEAIFLFLRNRIRREEAELYPLAGNL
jgi:hypothetical protein